MCRWFTYMPTLALAVRPMAMCSGMLGLLARAVVPLAARRAVPAVARAAVGPRGPLLLAEARRASSSSTSASDGAPSRWRRWRGIGATRLARARLPTVGALTQLVQVPVVWVEDVLVVDAAAAPAVPSTPTVTLANWAAQDDAHPWTVHVTNTSGAAVYIRMDYGR